MPNTFTQNPQANHTLANDQPPILANFQYIQGALGKDHQIVFNDSDTGTPFEGRHLQVSLNDQGANPAFPSDSVNTMLWAHSGDLYFRNNAPSSAIQLTNYQNTGAPVAGANGYTFLPGGLILQWGVVNPTSSTTVTVTFATANIAFPNNCYVVNITRQRTTSDPGSSYEYYIDNTSISKTQFQVLNRDGHSYGFYWIAIGN